MFCHPIKLAKIRKNAIFALFQRWFVTFANDCTLKLTNGLEKAQKLRLIKKYKVNLILKITFWFVTLKYVMKIISTKQQNDYVDLQASCGSQANASLL